jgi:FHS family L-fucose permease-like MFS transporter
MMFFSFATLPEITEDALAEEIQDVGLQDDQGPFWKQYRCIFGFVAQTAYVGAQVAVAAFAVNFFVDQGVGFDQSKASDLFSFCQITFTVGRFVGVVILNFVDPALLLAIYGFFCSFFCLLVSQLPGYGGVGCIFGLFFFESICYPCIFTLGTKNLGKYTKKGSGLIVMGVGGGAWYPSAQGALADLTYTRRSYLVPMSGYIAMMLYAIGLVVDQARKSGFTIRNRDELSERRVALENNVQPADDIVTPDTPQEKVVRVNSWRRHENGHPDN